MSKVMRIFIFLIGFAAFVAAPRAATVPSATQALTELAANMTGIYRLAYLNSGGAQKETLALVHQGRVVEVHTRRVQQQSYLQRKVQSRPAKSVNLASGTFNQLIAIAGGVNQNVSSSSPASQQNFLKTAGLAGSGSGGGKTPPVVPATNGQCPFAYELHISFKDGRKQVECRLKADLPLDLIEQMFAWSKNALSVSVAYAYYEWQWKVKYALEFWNWGFTHNDNWGGAGVSGWEFNGFGFQVLYLDTPNP